MGKQYFKLKDTLLQILDAWVVYGDFFQIIKQIRSDVSGRVDKKKLLEIEYRLSPEVNLNIRRIFGWFDLLGKLGGVTNVMMILFGFMIYPYSEHSYVLKVAKKLFIARTHEENLFKMDESKSLNTKGLSPKVQKELDLHRSIKLYKKDNICLFLSNQFGCLFPSKLWPKKK